MHTVDIWEEIIEDIDFEACESLEYWFEDSIYSYYWGECAEFLESIGTWDAIAFYKEYQQFNFGKVFAINPYNVANLIYQEVIKSACYSLICDLDIDVSDELKEEDYKKLEELKLEKKGELAREFEEEFNYYVTESREA